MCCCQVLHAGGGGSDQICSENERGSDHMHTGTGEMAKGFVFHCFMQTSSIDDPVIVTF